MTADARDGGGPIVVTEAVDDGAVRLVRFNRPEARNAFNFALYDAVTDAITDAAAIGRRPRGRAHRDGLCASVRART